MRSSFKSVGTTEKRVDNIVYPSLIFILIFCFCFGVNVSSAKKNIKAGYNHLANEKSPYLLQHSTNPVDWYPWTDEAFEKAKKKTSPFFFR